MTKRLLMAAIMFSGLVVSLNSFGWNDCTVNLVTANRQIINSFTDYNCDQAMRRCQDDLNWRQRNGQNPYARCEYAGGNNNGPRICDRSYDRCQRMCDEGRWAGFKYPQVQYCQTMCSNNVRSCERNEYRYDRCVDAFESNLNNCIVGTRQGADDRNINLCLQITNDNMQRCMN